MVALVCVCIHAGDQLVPSSAETSPPSQRGKVMWVSGMCVCVCVLEGAITALFLLFRKRVDRLIISLTTLLDTLGEFTHR